MIESFDWCRRRRITMAASVLLHIYASETNRRSRGDALQDAGFYVIENAAVRLPWLWQPPITQL